MKLSISSFFYAPWFDYLAWTKKLLWKDSSEFNSLEVDNETEAAIEMIEEAIEAKETITEVVVEVITKEDLEIQAIGQKAVLIVEKKVTTWKIVQSVSFWLYSTKA